MGTAVCIQCGHLKAAPFKPCQQCGFDPRGDKRAMAQSLMLSDRYYDPETDHRPDKRELQDLARRIRSCEAIEWDEKTLEGLSREQEVLERAGSPGWTRIVVFILALFLLISIPVAIIVAVLMTLRRHM